ncbi:MAG: DNA mismatch repair protein MutS [Bacteroidota bacterium]
MRQYKKIKDRHPNAILLFRMGDFYETFEHDAVLISDILGITLTKRSNGKAADVPLAGFPHHALDTHLPKLVRAGHRVAICEQTEDPKLAKKIVRRDVVEVVTPGVSFHDQLLQPKRATYLAAVHFHRERGREFVGFAFLDATTGEFSVTEAPIEHLSDLLQTIAPAELLYEKKHKQRVRDVVGNTVVATPLDDWCFGYDFCYETLLRHFRTHSLKGFGVDDLQIGLIAGGVAMHYLGETQKGRTPHVRRIARYTPDDHMALDPQTLRNLELMASMHDGGREGSLVGILDETKTSMGGRLLRKWLIRPLRRVDAIEQRLGAVDDLVGSNLLRQNVRDLLRHVGDLERLVAKVCLNRATPRDLSELRLTLRQIPGLKQALDSASDPTIQKLRDGLNLCAPVVDRIARTIVDEPPATLHAGGVIRSGFSAELDELRGLASSGKDFIAQLQARESERTEIPSLKVGFNKVFGYYIEIRNTHKDKVPDDYIRKQTLVNAERYITPELKAYEEKVLTAEEKIASLEEQLFAECRMAIADEAEALQRNASLLAMLDVFAGLAEVAVRRQYVRPTVDETGRLDIQDGRHPVVEASLPAGEAFVPNSVVLDPDAEQILMITGPNMAGKSVVLRQTGLIVLLAQVGSFVPAKQARIGLVDKIFTRVGASDNLAAGESTFLVEMNETASILNNATPRSLILLDEVGRGTSTFDGLSIAWAIVEHLHETPGVAARTLFATHYHELNALADRFGRIRNARIQVQEHDGKVIFLRRLVPGGADHSYGIEVARMAGLPETVVRRAREVLGHLEAQRLEVDAGGDSVPAGRRASVASVPEPAPQMSLFEADPAAQEIMDAVRALDPNRMTPLEALLKLVELRERAG